MQKKPLAKTLLGVDENAANFAKYFRRDGPPANEEVPCAPKLGLLSGRKGLYSRFRNALSPWIDCCHQVDIIRDRVEERSIALLLQTEIKAHCVAAGCYTEAVIRACKAIERFPQTSAGLFLFDCRGGAGRPARLVSNNRPEPRSLQNGE